MDIIRVTKEFSFEMAHALYGYEGPCKNIHGHSYHLLVCVTGEINQNPTGPDNGMVIDFSILKKIVKSYVVDRFDHALLLNSISAPRSFENGGEPFEKLILVDYQPTCENILVDIAEKIKANLPRGIKLHHLHLRETPNSFAEWYAEDNL
jgi:6-pyruvoyltetrahydropterin/6-carboxytetrahydropterin synthase